MSLPTYVRVRQPETGHEFSIVASALAAYPDLIVLDKDATRADGTPLRTKPHTTINAPRGATAEPKARKAATTGRKAATTGRKATSKKESS